MVSSTSANWFDKGETIKSQSVRKSTSEKKNRFPLKSAHWSIPAHVNRQCPLNQHMGSLCFLSHGSPCLVRRKSIFWNFGHFDFLTDWLLMIWGRRKNRKWIYFFLAITSPNFILYFFSPGPRKIFLSISSARQIIKRSGHLNFAATFCEIGPMSPKSWKMYQSKPEPTCPQDYVINLHLTPNYVIPSFIPWWNLQTDLQYFSQKIVRE